jgi:hypothetical protein
MAYADSRVLLYIVRAPVLKVKVAGSRFSFFFTAAGEVSRALQSAQGARAAGRRRPEELLRLRLFA